MSELTKEWLRSAIEGMETNRELFHGDLDDNHWKVLSALKMALAGMESGREEPQEYRKAAGEPVAYIGVNMLKDMRDESRQSGRVWINDIGAGECIPLYTTPQPAPAVESVPVVPDEQGKPHPVMAVKGELCFIDHFERLIDERDDDIDIGQLGSYNCEALMLAALDAFRAAMQQPGSNRDELPEWIKCSERMPEIGQYVLAYRPDAPVSNDPIIKMALFTGRSSHGFDCYCTPTHWMPLPAAPQQEVK